MSTVPHDGGDPDAPGEVLFETVAEEFFALYGKRWKPQTLEVNRIYPRHRIPPRFEGLLIDAITRDKVRK